MKVRLLVVGLICLMIMMAGCGTLSPEGVTQPAPVSPSSQPAASVAISAKADDNPVISTPQMQTTLNTSFLSPTSPATVTTLTPVIASKAFPGTIILGSPTDNTITLSLLASAGIDVFVQYGRVPGKYDSQSSIYNLPKGQPLELKIVGLNKDTQYFYRVCYRVTGETGFSANPESTFHSQRAAGDSFVFTVDADNHFDSNSDSNKIDLAFSGIFNLKPDFDIDLGDTFMAEKMNNPSSIQISDVYIQKRNDFGIFGGSVPLYMTTGNHDGGLGTNNVATLTTQAREQYYQSQYTDGFCFYSGVSKEVHLAGPHANYYSWEWGDALYVVLDPFWNSQRGKSGWEMTLGKAQYDWLKSTLEGSRAKYKFVFSHNLVGGSDANMRGGVEAAKFYEWGGQNTDGSWGFDTNRPGWGKPIHQLLVDNTVTIFFHGHDHFYAKQELDGVIYQECPQPGATNPKPHNVEYGYQNGVFLGSAGFLRVTVSSGFVTVDYIKTYLPSEESGDHKNGEVAYSYTLQK